MELRGPQLTSLRQQLATRDSFLRMVPLLPERARQDFVQVTLQLDKTALIQFSIIRIEMLRPIPLLPAFFLSLASSRAVSCS